MTDVEIVAWSTQLKVAALSITDFFMRLVPGGSPKNQLIPVNDVAQFLTKYGYHTGLITGMFKSINGGDNTRFDISSGTGIKVDKSDPENIIVTKVTYPGITGQLVTNLTKSFVHVYVDPDTQIVTTEDLPPDSLADINDRLYLGVLLLTNGVITGILDNPIMAYGSSTAEITEMVLGGGVTIMGGRVTTNSDLSLNVDPGAFQLHGRGREGDPNNPDIVEIGGQFPVPVGNFVKTYEDASNELVVDLVTNFMDPTQFNEDNLGILVPVANNQFTKLRLFYAVLTTGFTRLVLYRSTEQFALITLATSAVEPTFIEHINTLRLAPLADIIIREDVVDGIAAEAAGLLLIKRTIRRV